jgi:rod shape-determining protein MreC
LQRGVFSLSSIIHKAVNGALSFPTELWQRYVYLLNTEEKNRLLVEQNKRLRQENSILREAAIANDRLRHVLDFKETSPLKLLSAEVVSVDPSPYYKTVFVDKGEEDGVQRDLAVIRPGGLVGKIFKTSPSSSMVMLLLDQNFALDVLVQRTRARAVVEGLGTSRCALKCLLSSDPVLEGDLVVTSGLEGVFPKGILIGEIASISESTGAIFQDIVVEPMVEFEKLEEVLIILQ